MPDAAVPDSVLPDSVLPDPVLPDVAAPGTVVAPEGPVTSTEGPATSIEPVDAQVPAPLRVAAGWSWRLLVIGLAIYVLLLVVGRVRVVVIPVIAGLLISAMIYPTALGLRRRGVPRLASSFVTVFGFLILVAGAGVGVGFNAANEFPNLSDQISKGVEQVRDYLQDGPLHLSKSQLDDLTNDITTALANNRGRLVSGVLSGATVAAEVITGILLTLFATFFFVHDGDRIWDWIVARFPSGSEERVRGAGREAWATITGYIRGTMFVALVDAIGITIGLLAVGVPLVAPLALLTFLGGFIPIVGATVAGVAAILVTLVSNGLVPALVILGVVLGVQQIEGHLLQPLVMRRAVRLHPLAIVISLSAGGVLAGIPGAVAAVPFVAVINRVAGYLARSGKQPPAPDSCA
ncbi:AI-2E family transporter [Candidatus Protofrankia californiensis]|uniref:AI-2E family transporter n=1 Tax=Candidatus Protofrankia californiensis TaxID=1839754 RepID=UPI001F49D976|nr:AI-2E family transporter [Candidatus Protofrankia californiensis]